MVLCAGKKYQHNCATNRQDYAPVEQLAWEVLALYETSLKYPEQKLSGGEENKFNEKILQIVQAIKTDSTYPSGLTKPLKMFMESENGRGLLKWFFDRGFPTTAHCVDTETISNYKAYRFRLPFSESLEYRLTILVDENNEIVQMRWW